MIVARELVGWGVPSGQSTSDITMAAFVLVASGYTPTGLRTQSEARPSACFVELPSNPQFGTCSKRGKAVEFLDQSLASNIGNRLVAIEPDVFQFVLRHIVFG